MAPVNQGAAHCRQEVMQICQKEHHMQHDVRKVSCVLGYESFQLVIAFNYAHNTGFVYYLLSPNHKIASF
jgi:hypothetical protein